MDIRIGDIITIVKNTSGHNYIVGEKYKVITVNPANRILTAVQIEGSKIPDYGDGVWYGSGIRFDDIELYFNIDLLKDKIKNIKNSIDFENTKIDYLKKFNLETLDLEEFIVYSIINMSKRQDIEYEDKSRKIKKILFE